MLRSHRFHLMPHLPVSGRRDEVETAVDSVVWHGSAVYPRLCVQEVLTLTVDVVYDWLPTGKMEERSRAQDHRKKTDYLAKSNQMFL